MANKSPAFQWYAGDFTSLTQHLSAEEVGCYVRLLNYSWVNGPIPESRLNIIAGAQVTPEVVALFISDGPCHLISQIIEERRQEQLAYRRSRSKNAKVRWDAYALAMQAGSIDGELAQRMLTEGEDRRPKGKVRGKAKWKRKTEVLGEDQTQQPKEV